LTGDAVTTAEDIKTFDRITDFNAVGNIDFRTALSEDKLDLEVLTESCAKRNDVVFIGLEEQL